MNDDDRFCQKKLRGVVASVKSATDHLNSRLFIQIELINYICVMRAVDESNDLKKLVYFVLLMN